MILYIIEGYYTSEIADDYTEKIAITDSYMKAQLFIESLDDDTENKAYYFDEDEYLTNVNVYMTSDSDESGIWDFSRHWKMLPELSKRFTKKESE